MDRNSQEKKDRNRELVGESFEIIGNQALCTCTNGSKPASLSVVSQQKYYCNGAAKLIATNGDKDTRSLNFGNCKARNNSPCMAAIQWNQFYDKILIGKSLCPLTMKSEGTCVCGGKITFKTSGQQVMITPPLSMREAGQVVYSNPLFKKEDFKTVQKKEQKKSDTPLTQYSKNAFVNSVRVNGTVNVSLKVHGNEKLLFVHTLTRDADPSTPVKWDVTHNGKDISVGLLEPPLRSFFTEEGEYKVFAYVQNRGSKRGGGYVTLTVSEPKFVSLEWKDANEKKTHYMGRRHVVYAHTKFEGTGDIPVEARFYYKSLNGKQYLTNFAPLRIEQDGMAKIELSLTSSQVEEIKKVPIEKTPIYMELFSKEWIKDLKLSKKTPIEYTDKEDITSIAFYRDKDCKEAIKGFVESGQTIYARVTTRGLDDSDIALFIYKHGTVAEEETSTKGGVYKVSGETDAKGITVLKIKTDTSWLKEKQSETFDIFVLEGGAKETAVIMPNGRGYTERNTTKFFQMGKDKGILLLSMPKQDVEVGQSKTMVQEVNTEKNKCPRCEQDITLDEIKRICVDKKGNCLIKDTTMIAAALPYLNQYRKKVGINTCVSKAHFLAQIAQETKFYQLQEQFKYSNPERMRGIFKSYFETFGSLSALQKEAKRLSDLSKDSNNWPKVANAIYGPTHPLGKNHTNKGDGWRYSGKGFKQITWKDNYDKIEKYYNQYMKLKDEKNISWVSGDNSYKLKVSAKDAITSALAYWGAWGINHIAKENSEKCVREVTAKINTKLEGLNERIRYFNKAVEVLYVKKCLSGNSISSKDSQGTIIFINGMSHKYGTEFQKNEKKWTVYKLCIYKNMTYNRFNKLYKTNNLPQEDYSTYVARDAHMTSKKRSTLRYGTHNECPPKKKYYINKGLKEQSYDLYISDTKGMGKCYINGPDGSRSGIAIHGGWPVGSVGCLTTHTANYGNRKKGQKTNKIVTQIINNIPDLKDLSKDVILVLLERNVVKKGKLWFGIIE